jgi:hypothetical protein
MSESTHSPAELAQKIVSTVLKATQRETKQTAIATAIGMPESTLSRLLSDHLEKLALVPHAAEGHVIRTGHPEHGHRAAEPGGHRAAEYPNGRARR